jgi:hypothetical protein
VRHAQTRPSPIALSLETGLPVAFVRKARKDYGACLIAEDAGQRDLRCVATLSYIVELLVGSGGARQGGGRGG